jgi:hypothetical protein
MRSLSGWMTLGSITVATLCVMTACGDDEAETSTASGSTSVTSASAGSGASGGGGGGAYDCADYCTTVMENCTGPNAQYVAVGASTAQEICEGMCAFFPPGTFGDETGNTLGCRQYHAGAAGLGQPDFHCPHAGPMGGLTCGGDTLSQCDVFCFLAIDICSDQETPPYTSLAQCQEQCLGSGAGGGGGASGYAGHDEPFNTSDIAGDTFACRAYHLTATIDEALVHCPHVAAESDTCM